MSLACGLPLLECVYCLACARWAWKRCLHTGEADSATWGLASAADFEPVPRMCRLVMANYEPDLSASAPLLFAPPGGYGIDPACVLRRRTYADTRGRVTPYLLYLDHEHADIVLALRGLNLVKESDYALLLDNRLGKRRFDGGYVHNGLLRAAGWVLDAECDLLRDLLERYPGYTLTFTGHSLGAGIAAMLTMVVVLNLDKLGNVDRSRTRCYAMAPARCMSLNLAVRYADVINSVVLQDDFLPRTATPLEDIFKSILWCGRYPPVVKTAVPVDGRFEHIVLSCNATADHAIVWIEREAQKALDLMLEEETMAVPSEQRMERNETLQREHVEEHRAALRRAVTLSVPDARAPSPYGTFDDDVAGRRPQQPERSESFPPSGARQRMSWNDLIERVFDKDEDGQIVLRSSVFS
ncbi:calmodulin-binding heat-shock protein [Panicum miliaceum]|uniref:Calmodulin-binding heat-shock protein n=1 Tax=Panicum miliaceum TaxID=4540 RepID=A0A3L6QV73_PANMI|nr:calmodulin-binding heat-shock protein [Panicum miliaceum]